MEASWAAARVDDGLEVGCRADAAVTPASVMKVQVALALASAIEDGELDGLTRVSVGAAARTPGPVGISLMLDEVQLSLRDLLVPMLTISDNAATDAAISVLQLERVNALTQRLGLASTVIVDDLRGMLDRMAREVGFVDYAALVAYEPTEGEGLTESELRRRIAASSALDPARGSRTTPREMARLLSLICTGLAGPPDACVRLRFLMSNQLTRHRIASGFGSGYSVAAKSGGLLGVVRNEVGIVTDPSGRAFVLAIFTRREPPSPTPAQDIDAAIGDLAAQLVAHLQAAPG